MGHNTSCEIDLKRPMIGQANERNTLIQSVSCKANVYLESR